MRRVTNPNYISLNLIRLICSQIITVCVNQGPVKFNRLTSNIMISNNLNKLSRIIQSKTVHINRLFKIIIYQLIIIINLKNHINKFKIKTILLLIVSILKIYLNNQILLIN